MSLWNRWVWIALLAATPALFAVGCGDDDDDDNDNPPADDDTTDDDTVDDDTDDDGDDDDDLEFSVRWDYVLVDGVPAPANPETGAETPDLLNKIPVFRFRQDMGGEAPRPVRAILILVPGHTAGANQIRHIAQSMVELSEGEFEVWVPDRRFHLLEDLTGSNEAEKRGDPYIAYNYLENGLEVNGRTYQGLLDGKGPETEMLSEWGLDQQLQDYGTLLDLIPEESRATNVFFGGHSRGAWFAQVFAGWERESDRVIGNDLAGVILLDGGPRFEPDYTEDQYLEDIQKLRDGRLSRTTQFAFLTPDMYAYLEILTMAGAEGLGDPDDPTLGPDGFFPHLGPVNMLKWLMTRNTDVNVTNEALLGLASDDETGILENFHGHMGTLIGGEMCHDFLGNYPCEVGATYSWLNWDEVEPHELMDIQGFMRNIFEGPSNNADPYYTYRLDIDLYVADQAETEGTWRDAYFQMASSQMDAPVYVMATKLVAETGLMEEYRDLLPPVRGFAEPRTEVGYDLLYKTDWEHIDGLQVQPEFNDFFEDLEDWVDTWSGGDWVQVPVFGTPWDDVADQYPPYL